MKNVNAIKNATKGYFFCYDVNLYKWLSKLGFVHITKARTLSCTQIFCLYEQTPQLEQAITAFKQAK